MSLKEMPPINIFITINGDELNDKPKKKETEDAKVKKSDVSALLQGLKTLNDTIEATHTGSHHYGGG